jgi:hypothetical protein
MSKKKYEPRMRNLLAPRVLRNAPLIPRTHTPRELELLQEAKAEYDAYMNGRGEKTMKGKKRGKSIHIQSRRVVG